MYIVGKLGVCALTSARKWGKTKVILAYWKAGLDAGETQLLHKEKKLPNRGFLVYITRNLRNCAEVEMWRGNSNTEGMKLMETNNSSLISDRSLTSLDAT